MKTFGKQIGIEMIPPQRIKLNDDKMDGSIFCNARKTLKKEEMETNRESIRKYGLFHPLIVRPIKDPHYSYQLISGSRRLRNILGLIEIAFHAEKEKRSLNGDELCFHAEKEEWLPATKVYNKVLCVIRDCDDETAIRINIAENLEHAQVSDLDLMEYCQELVELKNPDGTPRYTREQVGDMCDRHESWVSLTLDLNLLPEKIKDSMRDGRLTRTAALSLLQTQEDRIDEVLEVAGNIIREQRKPELEATDKELQEINTNLEDLENDIEISDMMQDENLRNMALAKQTTYKKRASAASEKRTAVIQSINNPSYTADAINKANLIVRGAKKGKPKALPPKDIKSYYAQAKTHMEKNPEDPSIKAIINLFEVILGHRACTKFEEIFDTQIKTTIINES